MTMPFFIQTRDSMPIVKGSLVAALRMGGLLLGHCDSEELRTQGAQILSARLRDAKSAPLGNSLRLAFAQPRNGHGAAKAVNDFAIWVFVVHATYETILTTY